MARPRVEPLAEILLTRRIPQGWPIAVHHQREAVALSDTDTERTKPTYGQGQNIREIIKKLGGYAIFKNRNTKYIGFYNLASQGVQQKVEPET